jgi:hypothetical protein
MQYPTKGEDTKRRWKVGKVVLTHANKAQEGVEVQFYSLFQLRTKLWYVGTFMPWLLYP